MRRKVSAGVFDLGTRRAYAKKYELPQPDETHMSEIESDDKGSPRVCLDVCSEINGFQDCKTRCVPATPQENGTLSTVYSGSTSDTAKYHACRSACQVSYGISCDRAYPMTAPEGQSKFTNCLSSLQNECETLCSKYKRRAKS